MRRLLLIALFVSCCSVCLNAQIRFSAIAKVYNDNTFLYKQNISANIDSNGKGTMTIGTKTMEARVTNKIRDNKYGITAYCASLHYHSVISKDNDKYVDVVINIRDKGTCCVVVHFSGGPLRYDFSL